MKFWWLCNSIVAREIGEFPQICDGRYPVSPDDPRFSGNIWFTREEIPPITPVALLHKRSKLTDLLSCSIMGTNGMLFSDKMKAILESNKPDGLQFFPITVEDNRQVTYEYWLPNPYVFDYESLIFNKSTFEQRTLGNARVRKLSINKIAEFLDMQASLKLPEGISIENPVFDEDCNLDLIILRNTSGGIGYFVSDKLKTELETAKCTGIHYKPTGELFNINKN